MAKAPFEQPPFDRRILTFPYGLSDGEVSQGHDGQPENGKIMRGKRQLTRGYIRQTTPLPGYSKVAYFKFLYNPTTVGASYSVLQDVSAAMAYPNPDDTSDYNIPLGQALGPISLLFDRTYELWDKSYTSKKRSGVDVSSLGVGVDVMALRQLVGMDAPLGTDTLKTFVSDGSGTDASAPLSKVSDVMRNVQVDLFLGAYSRSLSFHGFIDQWSVEYTHYNQFMVPSRCVINLSMQLLPKKSSSSVVGGSSKTKSASAQGSATAKRKQQTQHGRRSGR